MPQPEVPTSLLSLLSRSKVVAWDLDHTLAEYARRDKLQLIWSGLRAYLTAEAGWPAAVLPEVLDVAWCQPGIVVDTWAGHALKLREDGVVLLAMLGLERCSGKPLGEVWPHMELLRSHARHERYFCFLAGFDLPGIVAWMHLVQAVRAGVPGLPMKLSEVDAERPYLQVREHLLGAFNHVFDNIEAFNTDRGLYFPAMKQEPARWVSPQDRSMAALQLLRRSRQRHALVTNSHVQYAHLIARAALGPAWRALFTSVVVNARKGGFFTSPGSPFYAVDAAGVQEGEVHTILQADLPCSACASKRPMAEAAESQVACRGNAAALRHLLSLDVAHPDCSTASTPWVSVELNVCPEHGSILPAMSRAKHSGADQAIDTAALPHTGHALPVSAGLEDALSDAGDGGSEPESAGEGAELVVYIGDHIHGDVAAPARAGWKSIAIVPAILHMSSEARAALAAALQLPVFQSAATPAPGPESSLEGVGDSWGPLWQAEGGQCTYFASVIQQNAVAIVASAGCVLDLCVQAQAKRDTSDP